MAYLEETWENIEKDYQDLLKDIGYGEKTAVFSENSAPPQGQ